MWINALSLDLNIALMVMRQILDISYYFSVVLVLLLILVLLQGHNKINSKLFLAFRV